MSKERAAGHYARAGQGKRKRLRHPPGKRVEPRIGPRAADVDDTAEDELIVGETVDIPEPDVRIRPSAPVAPRQLGRGSTLSRLNIRQGPARIPTDYGEVIYDLRRIGLLAGVAFVVLGVLAFVIQ